MKRLIVAGLAVLLIAGGGAAAWFFFLKAAPGDNVRDVHDTAGKPEFLDIDSLSVPVIRDGRVQKYVLLRLTLEMKDAKAKNIAKDAMPLVKDTFLNDLHGYFADQPPSENGVDGIDVRVVKARLMRVSDRLFGPGMVVNVLIQGAFERQWKPQ